MSRTQRVPGSAVEPLGGGGMFKASALMAKMKIAPRDRHQARLEVLADRLLEAESWQELLA